MIESFHWDNNYILGIESVDKQHKHLVDLTNQLAEIVSENKNDLKAIRKLIDKLSDYTIYHFHDEEAVMVKYRVDRRHIVYHKRKHSDFVNEIIEISSTITQENTQSLKYLLDFLSTSTNENITVGFNESNLPFCLEDDKFKTIIMPIILEK